MREKDFTSYLDSLLNFGLEYIAIIDSKGRMMEESVKNLRLDKGKLEMFCMTIRLQHSMNGDFDHELGPMNYILTERENMKFVSIPFFGNIIVAVSDKTGAIMSLIEKVNSEELLEAKLSMPVAPHANVLVNKPRDKIEQTIWL